MKGRYPFKVTDLMKCVGTGYATKKGFKSGTLIPALEALKSAKVPDASRVVSYVFNGRGATETVTINVAARKKPAEAEVEAGPTVH